MDLVSLLGLAIVMFVSTNIDDIFVLLGFLADPDVSLTAVAVGQYIGIGALVAVSLAGSALTAELVGARVGLLGLLPILVGCLKLVSLLRGRADDETQRPGARFGQIATVSLVTIANGGDNVAVYTPLFAGEGASAIAFVIGVFATMTGLWIAGANWLARHPALRAPLQRYGAIVVPFVLIALGIILICRAGTFGVLLGQSS